MAGGREPLQLILYFDETVLSSTLVVSKLILQDALVASLSYRLTNRVDLIQLSLSSIQLNISDSDIAGIRSQSPLAQSMAQTFLTIEANCIQDTILLLNLGTTISVTGYSADLVNPKLFISPGTLDLNTGILTLTFDDTLDVESVNIQFATFYNTSNSVGDNHTLFNASITTSSDTMAVSVTIENDNLNSIKTLPHIFDATTVYISLQSDYVRDVANNPSLPTNASSLPLLTILPDTTNPELVSFALDLMDGILSFTFSETIDTTAFIPSRYTLHNSGSIQSFTLTGGAG